MVNYTDNPVWEPTIQLVETTDLVAGGPSGNANAATKLLADRTAFLYNTSGAFESINQVANINGGPVLSSVQLSITDIRRKLVVGYQASDNYFTLILPAISSCRAGEVAKIKRLGGGSIIKPIIISTNGPDKLYDRDINDITSLGIVLHGGEQATIYCTGTAWVLLSFEGNLYNVGDTLFGYKQKPGTLIRQGQLISRADYPRLWAFASANNLLITDIAWSFNKSLFSSGTSGSNFRLPDDRGLFVRGMDLTAGIDTDRNTSGVGSQPGTRQTDQIKAHNHGLTIPDAQTSTTAAGTSTNGKVVTGNAANNGSVALTSDNAGGSETRPINVALYPLIYF